MKANKRGETRGWLIGILVLIVLGLGLNNFLPLKKKKEQNSVEYRYLASGYEGVFKEGNPLFLLKKNELGYPKIQATFSNNKTINVTVFYEYGGKKYTFTLKDKILNGNFHFFTYLRPNTPFIEGKYYNGKKIGIWNFYNFDYELWKTEEYSMSGGIQTTILKPQSANEVKDQLKMLDRLRLDTGSLQILMKIERYKQILLKVDSIKADIVNNTIFWKRYEKEYQNMLLEKY